MRPEPQTDDEGQPIDPAALQPLPAGGSLVRPAQQCFSAEDDGKVDTPTELPPQHLTDSHSEAASSAPALQSASTPTTGANNAGPKGVTEPFFKLRICVLNEVLTPLCVPLFEAGPHQVQHLGVHDVEFNYAVPNVGIWYLHIHKSVLI